MYLQLTQQVTYSALNVADYVGVLKTAFENGYCAASSLCNNVTYVYIAGITLSSSASIARRSASITYNAQFENVDPSVPPTGVLSTDTASLTSAINTAASVAGITVPATVGTIGTAIATPTPSPGSSSSSSIDTNTAIAIALVVFGAVLVLFSVAAWLWWKAHAQRTGLTEKVSTGVPSETDKDVPSFLEHKESDTAILTATVELQATSDGHKRNWRQQLPKSDMSELEIEVAAPDEHKTNWKQQLAPG